MNKLVLAFLLITTAARVSAAGILVVKSQNSEPYNQALTGFRAGCGDDIAEMNLGGSKSRAAELAKRLAEDKPRVIVAIGLLAAQMTKAEAGNLPIVFIMVSNPGRHGLSGQNIAGVSLDIAVTNQFSRYQTLLPSLKTLGVIYDPAKTGGLIAEARTAATQLGIELVAVEVDSQRKVRDALKTLFEKKIDALWMVPDETVITPESFKYLTAETSKNRVPFFAASDIFVEVGALAALTPDYQKLGRQGCQLAKAIESGKQKPAELGTAPPTEVNLVLNVKTASRIGVSFSQSVVTSATKVYQ